MARWIALLGLAAALLEAQSVKDKQKEAKDLRRQGAEAVPRLAALARDPGLAVRLEAVKALVDVGGIRTLDPLIAATQDPDPEMQARATDGLVNFYVPGYRKFGLSDSLERSGDAIRGRLSDKNDSLVDAYIAVRPEVQQAIGRLLVSGAGNLVRANAARAAGVLRNRAALPQLADALRSKDDRLMIEALDAMQKIGDPAIGPRVQFLLRDLEESVQVKAIETTGVLRNRAAWADLATAFNRPRTDRVRRAALSALAMLGEPQAHDVFAAALEDRDDQVRAAAAEGLGRLKRPAGLPRLATLFEAERKMPPRLALAFALTMMGKTELAEFSPLQYLINTLNNKAWRGYALAYLIEAAREEPVRRALNTAAAGGTRDEQTGLCAVLGASGDNSSLPVLERLTRSSDSDVANEAIRASRNLKARMQ